MNVTVLVGRVAREVKVASSGKTASVSLAVDRPYPFNKDKDDQKVTDFLTLKVIGEKQTQRAQQCLGKGTKICVRGVVCRDSWKDGNEWKEFNFVLVQDWEFAESKGGTPSGQKPDEDVAEFMNIPEGADFDVPFN